MPEINQSAQTTSSLSDGTVKVGDLVTAQSWGFDLDGKPFMCEVSDVRRFACNEHRTVFFKGGGFWSENGVTVVLTAKESQ